MTRRQLLLIVSVLMAIEVLCSLEVSMVATALPVIAREFPDMNKVGWLLTAFMLVQAGGGAIGGRLGDLYGRRRVLAVIVALCGLGSLLSAITSDLSLMIAGRAIQGLSGAILPLCYGIARESLPRERLPFWIGCLAGAYAAAAGIGYLLGGVLVDIGSWHLLFAFTAAYAALLLPLMLLLPGTPGAMRGGGRPDLLGGVLFVPAVASLLIGISNGNGWGWAASQTLGFIAGGAGLMVFWAWYESRQPEPLIDVKLLLVPQIAFANISLALSGLAVFLVSFLMLLVLQQPVATGIGLGLSAGMAGLFKIPSNIGSLVASPLTGLLFARVGGRITLFAAGMVGMTAGLVLILRHDSTMVVVLASVLATWSCAMMLAAVPNVVLEVVTKDRSGEVTGLSSAILGMANATGAQIIAFLLSRSRVEGPLPGQSFPSEEAFMTCFVLVSATAFVSALTGLMIPKTGINRSLKLSTS